MFKWLWSWIPVSRKRFDEQVRLCAETKSRCDNIHRVLIETNKRRESDLEERSKLVDEILKKQYQIKFDIEGQREYGIRLKFDPSMFHYGDDYSAHLRFVAERVSREVEHLICSAKFVKEAEHSRSGYMNSNNYGHTPFGHIPRTSGAHPFVR